MVDTTAPGQISVIGGNVDDAVTMKHVPVTADGHWQRLTGTGSTARYPWMVVLQVYAVIEPRRSTYRVTRAAAKRNAGSTLALPPGQALGLPSADSAAVTIRHPTAPSKPSATLIGVREASSLQRPPPPRGCAGRCGR